MWKKNSAPDFWAGDPQLLSTAALPQTVEGSFGQAPARTTADCQPSIVCSTDESALRRVTEAIDRLEADRAQAGAADLEARVAAVWSMVGEIHPDVARRASGYGEPTD